MMIETIGSMCEQRKVYVYCDGCDRNGWLDKSRVPNELKITEIADYLKGRCCKGMTVSISLIWDNGQFN